MQRSMHALVHSLYSMQGKLSDPSCFASAAQLPIPEAVSTKGSLAQAKDIVTDGGGVRGGEFSITDSP